MVSTGETAPTFTETRGTSDHEDFDIADHIGEGPIVLAFFPGAFTPPCESEMVGLQERYDEFREAGAELFGISADSPFAQGAFREKHGLEFALVSDVDGDTIEAFGLTMDIPDLGLYDVANRAVYVLDEDGVVTYEWIADDPTNEPDYEAILDAVRAA